MHDNTLKLCAQFVDKYLSNRADDALSILEVGSMKVGGGDIMRKFFTSEKWHYIGMDVAPGRNVDVVSEGLYSYPFEDNSQDVVLSANTLEHVQDMHRFVRELARVTKDLVYLDAPNRWKQHRYPVDCWRILPDGMVFLLEEIAGLKVLEVAIDGHNTYAIAKKYE